MKCPRCEGLMIHGRFIDDFSGDSDLWVTARKRVNCGYMEDQIMQQNRLLVVSLNHPTGCSMLSC